jgi:HSP20 family molecular chaperone IbpA
MERSPATTRTIANDMVMQSIAVNVYETDVALVIVAAMPGVMPEDVKVLLDGDVLTLRSHLRTPAPKNYLLHEWDYGRYERVLQLPAGFRGPVAASYGNGQLAVRVLRDGQRPRVELIEPASPLRSDATAGASDRSLRAP